MIATPVVINSKKLSLVLDLGTTGVKGFVFSPDGAVLSRVYERLPRSEPRPGWVEFDAVAVLDACRAVLCAALKQAGVTASDCIGLGITNQRETVVVWDRKSGTPVYPAIGWEDRRTEEWCQAFTAADPALVRRMREKTGLLLDPYFSAPKIRWVLQDALPKQTTQCMAGTLDTWIAYNWTGHHLTDLTNASRTLLLNIHTRRWDPELCTAFDIPMTLLPSVEPSVSEFGDIRAEVLGDPLPLRVIIGDQQSSLFVAGTAPGTAKITHGTGAFIAELLGPDFELTEGLFTTLALGPAGVSWYALEGKVEGVVKRAEEFPEGSNLWKEALRSIAVDVEHCIEKFPQKPTRIVVDGGISKSDVLLDFQRAASGCSIERSITTDATALGVHRLLQALE